MKIDLLSPSDHESFWVRQSAEVERILRELCRTESLLTLYAENGEDSSPSRVMEVDGTLKKLKLDCGPDETINARLAHSRSITVVANQHGIHIQFSAPAPVLDVDKGGRAWQLPWPDKLLRLQRRESYRLGTSLVHPIRCLVQTQQGTLETTLMDISVGGVAILAYEGGRFLETGQVLQGCRITLPDTAGEISCSLRIVNTFEVRLSNGRLSHRAGCQFVNLPASAETEIQRYILKTERERRSRYT